MKHLLTTSLLLCASLLGGCAGIEERTHPAYAPMEPITYTRPTEGISSGSLYSEQRGISLFSDTRARAVGDIISIVLPRITVPSAVTDVLKEVDLKNPNTMSTEEYNSYSGAAIGGTLIIFLLGATVFDVTGAIYCFLFAALNGGGLCAALALSETPASDPVNSFGTKVLDTLGGISVPRLTLPSAATDVMTDVGLKNPNAMSDAEYNAYSGAAIGGTLIFFLFPGAVYIDVTGAVFDFLFSALTGGGLCAALALSNTGASEPVNKFGAAVLSAVDTVGEKLK